MLDKFTSLLHIEKKVNFTDVTEDLRLFTALEYFRANDKFVLYVVNNVYNANKIYEKLLNVLSKDEIGLFITDEFVSTVLESSSSEYRYERINLLLEKISGRKKFIITHTLAYLTPQLKKESWEKNIFILKKGDIFSRDLLLEKLVSFGYTKSSLTTNRSEFSNKGYTVDFYGLDDLPYRIYYFDDEIEDIKKFDPLTQRTLESVSSIIVHPLIEVFVDSDDNIPEEVKDLDDVSKYSNYSSLFKCVTISEFFESVLFIDNYERVNDNYLTYLEEFAELKLNSDNLFNNVEELEKTILKEKHICLFSNNDTKFFNTFNIGSSEVLNYNNNFDLLVSEINRFNGIFIIEDYKNIDILLTKIAKEKNIINKIEEAKVDCINVIKKNTSLSFSIHKELFYLSAAKMFGKPIEKREKKFKDAIKIDSLDEIEINDYVVHIDYGIGIYKGIKLLDLNGIKNDFIHIIYKDSESLYVPIDKFDRIMKYASSDSFVPKINSINSKSWEKTKAKARARIKKLAVNLVEIYSKRKNTIGFACETDYQEQTLFENDFGYTLTDDQQKAVNDIKKDLESTYPMDRLLCGDVGFGKTEVALISSFKIVSNGKQVVYLCPTTILSSQHYKVFNERFEKYGFKVELVNRFVTPTKQKEIMKDLEVGKIHVLIGTHRILNKAFNFNDLGLLIIDEEQRFGVNQKETIKEIKSDLNVLTLSATPIPRTLQMSMMGIKDVSLINTPPKNRYPVQTYVMSYNKTLIKNILERELSRNGQAFYLHNNIDVLEEKAIAIKQMLPNSRVVVVHGRLSSNELEDRMLAFLNKEYDILVCTTIIETGIDVGNANTIIIDGAQNFGLSQLYQIRGRVGRSDKIAFCYLVTTINKTLSDVQDKRLTTIKEFTSLGSGYKIASKDLSIRGAGDVLGAEQSGFINDIGVDLYFEILDEEIQMVKGTYKEKEEVTINQAIKGNKYISDRYISEDQIKLEMHKQIKSIDSFYDLDKITEDFKDKYGYIDDETIDFMKRSFANKKLSVFESKIESDGYQFLELSFSKEVSSKIDGEKLMSALVQTSRFIDLSYKNEKIYVKVDKKELGKDYLITLVKFLDTYLTI